MSRELADHLKLRRRDRCDRREPRREVAALRLNAPRYLRHPWYLMAPERHRLSGQLPRRARVLRGHQIRHRPACTRCKLCTLGRSQIVFGVGHPQARLMFVGEAPGEEEDKRGEPFVGRAGQLLTKIIEAIGLTREQVYIANVIKCRPPGNRNPEHDEVAQCEPFLFRQIDAIQPHVIVPLGKFAAQSLLKTMDPITRLRGRQFDYRGAVLIPTFHPGVPASQPSAKREVWEDMKKVRRDPSIRGVGLCRLRSCFLFINLSVSDRLVSVAVPVPRSAS